MIATKNSSYGVAGHEPGNRVGDLAESTAHRVGRHDEVGGGQRVQSVVGIEAGRFPHDVRCTADVLQVVDVLEEAAVAQHRVTYRRGQRSAERLVGELERSVEQRNRLPVDHLPIAGRRRCRAPPAPDCRRSGATRRRARSARRVTRRPRGAAPRRRARRAVHSATGIPSVACRLGACRRCGEPSTMSSCTSVPRCSSSHCRCTPDRRLAVAAIRQRQHDPGPVPRAGRRGGPSASATRRSRVATTGDQAIDVGQCERLVHHVARR